MTLRRVGYPAVTSYAIVPDALKGTPIPGGSGGNVGASTVNSCPALQTQEEE